MKRLIAHLQTKGAKSITPVTLFKRSYSYMEDLIYGFELQGESFLVGYGLDGKGGLKRNQAYITGEMIDD
jgi:hypoxanthine-guanine phosphoribosyltransferase